MLDLDTVFDPARVDAVIAARHRSGQSCRESDEAPILKPICIWSTPDVDDLPGDWRVWFEERAAIKEYCGGMSRELAEAQALAETVKRMQTEKN